VAGIRLWRMFLCETDGKGFWCPIMKRQKCSKEFDVSYHQDKNFMNKRMTWSGKRGRLILVTQYRISSKEST